MGVTAEKGRLSFYYTTCQEETFPLYDFVSDSMKSSDAGSALTEPARPNWFDDYFPMYFRYLRQRPVLLGRQGVPPRRPGRGVPVARPGGILQELLSGSVNRRDRAGSLSLPGKRGTHMLEKRNAGRLRDV